MFFPGLSRSPTPRQLERALDELNAGRPQCPVGLHTLIVPRKNSQNIAPEAQPMVYLKCGHVQVLLFLFFFKSKLGISGFPLNFWNTVELGNKKLFGCPKIVP